MQRIIRSHVMVKSTDDYREFLHSSHLGLLGHQLLVLLPESVHTVNHLLHQLDLRAETEGLY